MASDYLKTLLRYYEGELVGEAYFCALAGCFHGAAEREKLALLATVERRTSEVVRPLVDKHLLSTTTGPGGRNNVPLEADRGG